MEKYLMELFHWLRKADIISAGENTETFKYLKQMVMVKLF